MTVPLSPINPAASSSPRMSRRDCLGWAATGLAMPLLQACGGGSSGPAFGPLAPVTPADPESVRWCRDAILAELARSDSRAKALSVALMADDRVIWSEAFGVSDRDQGTLTTTDTRFNVGSVAKVVTALAVMILRDRGQLGLDQPLAELLSRFRMRSPEYTQITVRHLISHSSGVPGTNARNMINFAPYADYAQETLDALANSRLKHAPGELQVYCNDGFTLVDPLVQQLTGQAFTDFVQREIFQPLGMNHTGYTTAPLPEGTFVHPSQDGKQLPQEMLSSYSAGGMFSTPTDMMKLARLFMDKGMYDGRRIVSADGVQQMAVNQTPRFTINPAASSWSRGLGWDDTAQMGLAAAGLQCWEKSGGTYYAVCEFFVAPEARLAVMIITDGSGDVAPLPLSEGLMLRAAQERGAIPALPPAISPVRPPLASRAPDTANQVGVYAASNAPLQILAAGAGALTLHVWSTTGWNLVGTTLRLRDDDFWWDDDRADRCFRFETVAGHRYLIARVLSANQFYWREQPLAEWLPPLDTPLPPAWKKRVGTRWKCTNESPDSIVRAIGITLGELDELKELPGYVLWSHSQLLRVLNDDEATMTVKVPAVAGRDLVELSFSTVNGKEQLDSGGMLFERVAD